MKWITVATYEKDEGYTGTEETCKPKYRIVETSNTQPCSCGAIAQGRYKCFAIDTEEDISFLSDNQSTGSEEGGDLVIQRGNRYVFDYDTVGASCGDTITSTDIIDLSDDSAISALEA